jgi:hypothetical protein
MTQRVVTSTGQPHWIVPATVVHVGSPYDVGAEHPPDGDPDGGRSGRVASRTSTRVNLRVYRSSGIFVGPSGSRLVEFKQRTTEPYGSPPGHEDRGDRH